MATRLTLLCHAATATMRDGAFPAPEDPIDEGGARKLAGYRVDGAGPAVAMTSPALAARQTADAIGLDAAITLSLRDIDHGDWTGQAFATLGQRDPAAFSRWLADPAKGVAGGESLNDVVVRLSPWLEAQAARDAHVLAVTHPMVIRAILSIALDISTISTMRIDIAPLSTTVLSFNGGWRLQSIAAD